MPSRALGAILAVLAVLALTGSLVAGLVPRDLVPGWWDGHPRVDGKLIERKDIHVGLLAATGCNLGETVTCEDVLEIGATTRTAGIGELAAVGLADVIAIALLVSIWRIGDRRKGLAKLALATSAIVAAGAGVLVLLGPDIAAKQHVDVPIGPGLVLAWGAVAANALASVIALGLEPEPLRLKTSLRAAVDPALANTVDVREILREQHDSLRPAALGPEPRLGGAPGPVAFAPAPPAAAPLVPAAPQLRPLYDAQGAMPVPQTPALPSRAPTPLPRASMRALAGIDTPPPAQPIASPRGLREHLAAPAGDDDDDDAPDSQPIDPPPPPAPPAPLPPLSPSPPLRVPALAEPARKQPTIPPTPPRATPAPRGSQPGMRPSQPLLRPSPPPPGPRKPPGAVAQPIAEKRTLAHAVPPPPTVETQPPPAKLPAHDARLATDNDDRLATAMRETDYITAVEIDAEAKAAAVARQQTARPAEPAAERQATEPASDDPDTGVEIAAVPAAPVPAAPVLAAPVPAAPVPSAVTAESTDQVDAHERPDTEGARPTEPVHVQVPISTAPASLPPPKKTEVAITGPTPACPQCEAPMAWVEEHLRFYCKQCKMYF